MEIVCSGIRVVVAEAPVDADQDALAREVCALLPFDVEDRHVRKTELGAPRFAGAGLVPALSFSRAGERLWGAAAWVDGLGVDVACPEEFMEPYPVDRVFSPVEIRGMEVLGLDGKSGYALLWSFKEATAKALGTGFSRVEPIQLSVLEPGRDGEMVHAGVLTPVGELPVLAVPVGKCWLAVALARHIEEDFDA